MIFCTGLWHNHETIIETIITEMRGVVAGAVVGATEADTEGVEGVVGTGQEDLLPTHPDIMDLPPHITILPVTTIHRHTGVVTPGIVTTGADAVTILLQVITQMSGFDLYVLMPVGGVGI